jgi:3-oxoacyl-[acyl-carrier-protein] synthase-1
VGVAFHTTSQIFPDGNAAAFAALARSRELLAGGTVSACVIGGVDSFLNVPDLHRFGSAFRLKSDDVAQGFIPGEAAAFVAVTAPEKAGDRRVLGQIRGLGLAREAEDTTVLSNGYPNGKGLEQALRAAIADAGLPEADIAFRVSDVNGETYRGQENMLAMTRFYRTSRSIFPPLFPASCLGETGAATGALLLIVALTAMNKGYAPGRVAMCEAASDGGLRAGAVVVHQPG